VGKLALTPALLAGLDSKAVRLAKRGTVKGSPFVFLAILTKWFSSTRLETRTKESNIYASIWVANPDA
jgi:hypothetical protein